METEQDDGDHAGNDDGQGAGESLEDVVGVFDDDGHQEAAGGVEEYQVDDKQVVAEKESVFGDPSSVLGKTDKNAQRNGQDAQLNVSHPHRHSGAWKNGRKIATFS